MLSSKTIRWHFQISRLPKCALQMIRPIFVSSTRPVPGAPLLEWMFGSKDAVLAKRMPSTNEIHGYQIMDEFNWLRHRKSKDVRKYIKQENNYTENCLGDTVHFQKKLLHEMCYWSPLSHELESIPERIDNYVYYIKSPPDDDQFPVVCRRRILNDGSYDDPQIILNQNELANLYQHVSVSNFKLSPSRKLAAFTLDSTGTETYSGQIITVWDGPLDVIDTLTNVVNVEWGSDDTTIFYTTPDHLKRSHRLWRHTIGEDMSKDVLLFEEKHERYFLDVSSTKDRTLITVNSNAKTASEVSLIDSSDGAFKHKPLYPRVQGTEYYVEHRGNEFFIITNAGGFNYRVVRVDDSKPSKENWRDLLPQQKEVFIDDMELFEDYCVLYERYHTSPRLSVVPLDSPHNLHSIKLPDEVCVLQPGTNQMFKSDVVRFTMSSPIQPPKVIEYHMESESMVELNPVLSRRPSYSSADYKCTRLEVPSKDGTQIPMTIFHHRDVKKNGQNPILLHVYGAYGVNINMGFTPERLCLLTRGWVLAFCHVRGGGELGREWYLQARLHNKHRSFEDFEACTTAVQDMGYSNPALTAARGVSAGGVVIGAVCNRSPHLYRALVMKVPFLDVLTTMLDGSLPLTAQEYDEWGDPRSSENDFNYIKSYCPYHNIEHKDYPSMFVCGSVHDDRVPYWVPLKYVAKMRQQTVHNKDTDRALTLCTIDCEGGHFGDAQGSFEEMAKEYAFLHKSLGLPLT